MSGPNNCGWGPPADPYEQGSGAQGSGAYGSGAIGSGAQGWSAPPPSNYGAAPYGGGSYGAGPGNYGPSGPYQPYGAPNPGRGGNRAIIAVTAVVVLAIIVGGVVYATTRGGGSNPKPTAGPTGVSVSTSAGGSATTTSAAATATADTATADTASASTTTAATSSASTSSAPTALPTDENLCIEDDASTNLIHLTVTLSFASSYANADAFDKRVVKSCVTPAAIKELGPYFGKSFGLPGGDLTGNDGSGPTARYSVQLVNTSRYVTFTLDRKSGTSGYQVVSISG